MLRSDYVQYLVQFKHKLLEVLNFKLSKQQMEGSPIYGIQAITRLINIWKSMDLFSYLTEDIFWVVVFLRMYNPQTELYQKAVQHSMEFIHRMENNEDVATKANLLYPICLFLMTCMNGLLRSIFLLWSILIRMGELGSKSKMKTVMMLTETVRAILEIHWLTLNGLCRRGEQYY